MCGRFCRIWGLSLLVSWPTTQLSIGVSEVMAWQLLAEYQLSLQSPKRIDVTWKQSVSRWAIYMDQMYWVSLTVEFSTMSSVTEDRRWAQAWQKMNRIFGVIGWFNWVENFSIFLCWGHRGLRSSSVPPGEDVKSLFMRGHSFCMRTTAWHWLWKVKSLHSIFSVKCQSLLKHNWALQILGADFLELHILILHQCF